jgi:hypothetical protein
MKIITSLLSNENERTNFFLKNYVLTNQLDMEWFGGISSGNASIQSFVYGDNRPTGTGTVARTIHLYDSMHASTYPKT